MATIEATTVERQHQTEGEAALGESSGIVAPIIPPDLLTFDLIAEFLAATDPDNVVSEELQTAAAPISVVADADPALVAPSEPASVFSETIETDRHDHKATLQARG